MIFTASIMMKKTNYSRVLLPFSPAYTYLAVTDFKKNEPVQA